MGRPSSSRNPTSRISSAPCCSNNSSTCPESINRPLPPEQYVAARQLLQRPDAMFPVIDRREQSGAQEIRQLAGIDAVVLVAGIEQSFLARIADQDFTDMGLEHIVQPGGAGTFVQGHVQTAAQTMNKLKNRCRLSLENR